MQKKSRNFDYEKAVMGIEDLNPGFFDEGYRWFRIARQIFDTIKDGNKKRKLLDAGCGAGAKTRLLKRYYPGFEYFACDITNKGIDMAKKDPKGIKYFIGDATKLPVKDGQYDIVFMNSVLDHTLNPRKAASEVNRVLKKGGIYIVTGPLEADLTTIHGWFTKYLKGFRQHRKERCGHNFAFSKKTFIKLLNNSGFRIEQFIPTWFYFSQIIDILFYPFVQILGKGPEFNFEHYCYKEKSLRSKAISLIRSILIILENTESVIMQDFPFGFFVFVKAKKVRNI